MNAPHDPAQLEFERSFTAFPAARAARAREACRISREWRMIVLREVAPDMNVARNCLVEDGK